MLSSTLEKTCPWWKDRATSKIQDLARALQISKHCWLPLAEHSSRMPL